MTRSGARRFMMTGNFSSGGRWDVFRPGCPGGRFCTSGENFRRAFDNFDAAVIAAYDEDKITALLADEGIVRNRSKVRGAVRNARSFLRLVEGVGARLPNGSGVLWTANPWPPAAPLTPELIPAETEIARSLSKALRKADFTFVGPTICYAFMQSVGMVDDHVVGCFKYQGPIPAGGGN